MQRLTSSWLPQELFVLHAELAHAMSYPPCATGHQRQHTRARAQTHDAQRSTPTTHNGQLLCVRQTPKSIPRAPLPWYITTFPYLPPYAECSLSTATDKARRTRHEKLCISSPSCDLETHWAMTATHKRRHVAPRQRVVGQVMTPRRKLFVSSTPSRKSVHCVNGGMEWGSGLNTRVAYVVIIAALGASVVPYVLLPCALDA
eukprot:scaffold4469_cov26-Tisochrysis_lutea.AAC.2